MPPLSILTITSLKSWSGSGCSVTKTSQFSIINIYLCNLKPWSHNLGFAASHSSPFSTRSSRLYTRSLCKISPNAFISRRLCALKIFQTWIRFYEVNISDLFSNFIAAIRLTSCISALSIITKTYNAFRLYFFKKSASPYIKILLFFSISKSEKDKNSPG